MKKGLTKIHHEHLEFVFDYEDHKVYVRDHMFKKKYELTPSAQSDFPFMVSLHKYLDK